MCLRIWIDGGETRLHSDDHQRRDAQGDTEGRGHERLQEELHQRLAARSQSLAEHVRQRGQRLHALLCRIQCW